MRGSICNRSDGTVIHLSSLLNVIEQGCKCQFNWQHQIPQLCGHAPEADDEATIRLLLDKIPHMYPEQKRVEPGKVVLLDATSTFSLAGDKVIEMTFEKGALA